MINLTKGENITYIVKITNHLNLAVNLPSKYGLTKAVSDEMWEDTFKRQINLNNKYDLAESLLSYFNMVLNFRDYMIDKIDDIRRIYGLRTHYGLDKISGSYLRVILEIATSVSAIRFLSERITRVTNKNVVEFLEDISKYDKEYEIAMDYVKIKNEVSDILKEIYNVEI